MGERILILDDERSILDLLNQYLSAEGYECVSCETGADAWKKLGQAPFAVLLVDLGLPDIDGLDVVREVRAADREVGIIVITGHTAVTEAVNALRYGADDYLIKPLNFPQISMSVSKVLEKRNLVIQNRQHQQNLEKRVVEATEDLKRANRELIRTKEYLENLLHSTVDTIITCEPGGNVSFANEGALQMLGYTQPELVGKPMADILVGEADEVRYLSRTIGNGRPLQNYETELKQKTGPTVPVSLSISLVHDADGQVVSWLALGKDITEQRRLRQELKEMSVKDSLTGLYNHRHFYERLGAEVERARRQRRALSLLLLDLDQFKPYNDRFGHLAGDEVLRAVREVVVECTREHVDLGFRYGGDEFTVILPEAEEKQACHVAERIRTTFASCEFEGITMSIGVMAYRPDYNMQRFVQCADAMMYEAKRAGGNRICVYRLDESQGPPCGAPSQETPGGEGKDG